MIRSSLAVATLLLLTTPMASAQTQDVPLAAVAGTARYSLAASADIMLNSLDPESRRVMAQTLAGEVDFIPGHLWSRVMAGAMQVRREATDSADTLWFNPVLDSGLVVRWVPDGNAWRVLAAAPVTGENLRDEPSVYPIAWPMAGGSLQASLRASAITSFAAADAGSWDRLFEAAPQAQNVVMRRAYVAGNALDELTATPGYGDSLSLLYRLLGTDDPKASKLPPALVRSLAEMGDAARLSLRPITAFRLTDGWSVALQSPDAPGVVWLVSFADPVAGEPALPVSFSAVGMDQPIEEAKP